MCGGVWLWLCVGVLGVCVDRECVGCRCVGVCGCGCVCMYWECMQTGSVLRVGVGVGVCGCGCVWVLGVYCMKV